ncbi:MAG: class I SAM-dependent methyltransferase [Myxococcota bacterium]
MSINQYDRFAEQYNQLMLGGYYDYDRQATALEAVLPPGASILEIGVGTGLLAKALVDRGWKVAGMDHTAEMLEQARTLLGPDVRLEQADATVFDLEQTFDAVISNGGVWYAVQDEGSELGYCGHLPTAEGVRASLQRVAAHLGPAGRLVLSVQHRHHDRAMSLPDDVEYRQTITDQGREGPIHAFDKEYRFDREGATVMSTTLRLAYIDTAWFEGELRALGFGTPRQTEDGQYVVFHRE